MIFKYKESLSEEGRKALEWIASQEAEEALQKYALEKGEDDPVIDMLRARALATLELPSNAKKVEAGGMWRGTIDKDWATRCRETLKLFGSSMIEDILADPHSDNSQKIHRLKDLGADLAEGIQYAVDGDFTSVAMSQSETKHWGLFISELVNTGGNPGAILGIISKEAMTPRGTLIQKQLPLFEQVRRSYPELGEKMDKLMEMDGIGWLWDSKNNKYISING